MNELDQAPIDRSERTRPLSTGEPPRRDGAPVAVIAAVVLAVLVAVSGWYWLRGGRERAAQAEPAAAPASAAPESAAPAAAAPEPLPPLDASDPFVRDAARALSSEPRFAAWLADDGLLRRYVAAVAGLGEGTVPTGPLAFLRPAGRFEVRRAGGRTIADDAAYARYDSATGIFLSLDTAKVAALHRRLRPLLEEAWREVGDPALSFDQALARAVAPLLAVAVPEAAPELVADGVVWRYARPDLEALSAAQKQLLRLGPANARRAQAKLRELARALALTTS